NRGPPGRTRSDEGADIRSMSVTPCGLSDAGSGSLRSAVHSRTVLVTTEARAPASCASARDTDQRSYRDRPSATMFLATSFTTSSERRTPKDGLAPSFSPPPAPGSHQTTEYPSFSKVCLPGQTVVGPAGSLFGRTSTESLDLNAGHFGPRVAIRRLPSVG